MSDLHPPPTPTPESEQADYSHTDGDHGHNGHGHGRLRQDRRRARGWSVRPPLATDPTSFHLLLLDNGAFHKAHTLRLPPNLGLLFFPPYSPELNPIERLWRDLKDWLAPFPPTSLSTVSTLICRRLQQYSPATLRSLTGFPYLLSAVQSVTVL